MEQEQLVNLLRMYHSFLRTLSLEGLPRLVYQLAGELGFGSLARLYAETTRHYIEDVLKLPQEKRSPRQLLEMMKSAMQTAMSVVNEPLFEFSLEERNGALIFHLPVRKRDKIDTLRAAPVLGMVAGVFEASGYRVYTVADEKKKHVAPRGQPGTAIVALVDCGDHTCIEVEHWPPNS